MSFFLLVSVYGTPIYPGMPNLNVYVCKILSVGKVGFFLSLSLMPQTSDHLFS